MQPERPSDEVATVQGDRTAWLGRVRFGVNLLFWATLLPSLLTVLCSFATRFGWGSGTYFKWIGPIHTISGIPALIAVIALSAAPPTKATSLRDDVLRRAVRIFAWLELLRRFVLNAMRIAGVSIDVLQPSILVTAVGVSSIWLGLMYLAHLSRGLVLEKLRRGFLCVSCAYIAIALAFEARELLGVDTGLAWQLRILLSLYLVVWIWGLVLLRRLGGKLTLALTGRCVGCGYILRGLPDPRCPECGRPFEPAVTP